MSMMTSSAGAYPEFPKWICRCYRWGLKFQCVFTSPNGTACPKRWDEMKQTAGRQYDY